MNHFKFVLAAAVGSVAQLASAETADIRFYADNYCTGNHVAYFDSDIASRANCTFGKVCRNDVYRSIWVRATIKADTVIKVWDSPEASINDDWAQINFKQPATWASFNMMKKDPNDKGSDLWGNCIYSFETNEAGPYYNIEYHRKNGLDGKISAIQIMPAPAKPAPTLKFKRIH